MLLELNAPCMTRESPSGMEHEGVSLTLDGTQVNLDGACTLPRKFHTKIALSPRVNGQIILALHRSKPRFPYEISDTLKAKLRG